MVKNKTELDLKKDLENAMTVSINGIIKTFHECPMFYLNEEDIRCDLYRHVSNNYSHTIYVRNLHGNVFLSSAVHVDAIVKMQNEKEKPKPDLIGYFAKNTKKNPIPVGNVKSKSKPENIHFFTRTDDGNNKKRVIVEIKFTGHSNGISKDKIEGIDDDLEKLSNREAWKRYMLYFDRSNQWDEKLIFFDDKGNIMNKTDMKNKKASKYIKFNNYIINRLKKTYEDTEGDIEFYYLGIPSFKSDKEEQLHHYINGIKDEKFDVSF